MNNDVLINFGKVLDTTDSKHGGRIKVVLEGDKINDNVSFDHKDNIFLDAFPLMPKVFHSIPKVGETVFVITRKLNDEKSQRLYIGPIISQPQFFAKDTYPQCISLLQNSDSSHPPFETIDTAKDRTNGSFPEKEDIAIVGRKNNDIILKENEISIRNGIRVNNNETAQNIAGHVIFNTNSPSYIQLKYKNSGITKGPLKEANSIINIVADKINLISYRNEKNVIGTYDKIAKNGELLNDDDMEEMMKQLHSLPYGDILCTMLQKFQMAFLNHVHPYPGIRPCQKGTNCMEEVAKMDFTEILSPNVRIN